ncbi:TonB-dependent receptor family protein [Flavobacterium kingsejongi]|uniref:TonB-dependent receptor n=1 Tax=Flavobacterium kingsejongi TaxID=1678728 RepID=A0A2S1LNN8_9FLAO|nr:TonB-dependent receptor [Flavobacterium kingsejongi]AWG25282.1 TonB-dependent receptor [Flavobacterium kingsejongi]
MSKYYFLLCFLGTAFLASAQEKPKDSLSQQLEIVHISAFHINDSLLNAPAAIGIVSAADLQRNNLTDISPALNRIAGVYMQSAVINTNRISIRGIGARTPYGTNKIRAFYGSIPLTSGDAETTIEDLNIENIQQVEIIKGPLSSVYGAGLGGAILLTPITAAAPGSTASITSTHGSFGLVKNNINYSLDTPQSSLNINYHKLKTDGWRENSAYNREGVTLAGELFRKPHSKLTYIANYTDMKAFIPSSVSRESFEQTPSLAAPTWKAAKGFEDYTAYMVGLSYEFDLSPGIRNNTSVYAATKDSNEPRPFDILKQKTAAFGGRTQFTGNFHIASLDSRFIAGFEYFRDHYKGKTLENLYQQNNGVGSLEGNPISDTQQYREFYNAFLQFRIQFSPKTEIQAGLSVNTTQFELENRMPQSPPETYSYDPIWSPQLAFLFKPTSHQTFYASASRGFSLPSVAETLTDSGNINAEIKPETGYNFEIGSKLYWLDKRLYTEITLYHMQIKDLLVAQRVGDDQYIGINAGKTIHQGLEVSIHYNASLNGTFSVQPFATASLGRYRFDTFLNNGTDFSGNHLTGVPSNKVNSGIMITSRFGLYLSGEFEFVDRIPLNDGNTMYSDAYRIVNFKTGYRFTLLPGFTSHIATGINNALNEKYAAMVLVNATGVGSATPRYYYPGLPVNYYASLSFNYSF